ncbi:hypothetical protein [Mycobacterium sp. C31M]
MAPALMASQVPTPVDTAPNLARPCWTPTIDPGWNGCGGSTAW